MTGKVQDGFLIGCCLIFDDEFIIIGKSIGHPYGNFSGETFLTIGADIFEDKGLIANLIGVPHLSIESFLASVQTIGAVVHRQMIFITMELETSFCNAIAIASD